jgi:hypothetical protein
MIENIMGRQVDVVESNNLYKWAKIWGKVQKNYYKDPVYLRREKQIEDFVFLNEFDRIYIEKDTDILKNFNTVSSPKQADLVIITDQKFSRMPCHGIVEKINYFLEQCNDMYLCLNRHYINIDNTFVDTSLDANFNLAITQWLKQNLPNVQIVDLSLDYIDAGDYFTWVVPDRMYYIKKCN